MEDLLKKINAANREIITDEDAVEEEPQTSEQSEAAAPRPVDMLQEQRNIAREYSQKQYPRGARRQVLATIQDVINGVGTDSLAQAYKRARDDSEAVDKMGDHRRAQIIKNQYMQEKFLPAIEVVVNFTSPDELLNCKRGLSTLDKYALGVGSMSGYTAAYVRAAYGDTLGQMPAASSPEVNDAVARLVGFLDTDQMVLAKSLAKKIKGKIDDGETIASQEDYDLILNVVNNWPK